VFVNHSSPNLGHSLVLEMLNIGLGLFRNQVPKMLAVNFKGKIFQYGYKRLCHSMHLLLKCHGGLSTSHAMCVSRI
jgi:hypothetical protein